MLFLVQVTNGIQVPDAVIGNHNSACTIFDNNKKLKLHKAVC